MAWWCSEPPLVDDRRIAEVGDRLRAVLGDQLEIGELIGAGGFSAVFRARDTLLGRDVAIKVLDPSRAPDAAGADRLLDEARLVATIEHPHIVPLYEAGHRDGLVFLVMRYFPDGTAGSRLAQSGPSPPSAIARLGMEVADALAAAHARGVIHLTSSRQHPARLGGHAAALRIAWQRRAGANRSGMVSTRIT
jgi:serine/threonine-protein kinase